jgi:hypothetical protein
LIPVRDSPVLGHSSPRAPAPVRESNFEGGIERGPIHPRLAA